MEKSPEGTKIVIFDIMGEYLTLLIDLLIKYEDSKIIGVGAQTFVEDLYAYYNGSKGIGDAVDAIVKTNLYPKRLLPYREKFKKPIQELIKRKALRVYESGRFKTINEVFEEAGFYEMNIAKDDKQKIQDILKKYSGRLANEVGKEVLSEIDTELPSAGANAKKFIAKLKNRLKTSDVEILDESVFISIKSELIEELNDQNKKAIYIIQSHNPDELKRFVNDLANIIYEDRRRTGRIIPLVSFIFDEADEYIPQDKYEKGESKISRQAVEMLARRGRKFGLGIGIATQRVVYLDTNIMAQPHTYFISKLPRSSDRERIAEAFAIGQNVFEQTFKFGKGDWLLVSHDATGLEAIPFPIHTDNAEERIIEFLENFNAN